MERRKFLAASSLIGITGCLNMSQEQGESNSSGINKKPDKQKMSKLSFVELETYLKIDSSKKDIIIHGDKLIVPGEAYDLETGKKTEKFDGTDFVKKLENGFLTKKGTQLVKYNWKFDQKWDSIDLGNNTDISIESFDDIIYLEGRRLALDPKKGELIWRKKKSGRFYVAQNAVYYVHDNWIYRLDHKTGESLWKKNQQTRRVTTFDSSLVFQSGNSSPWKVLSSNKIDLWEFNALNALGNSNILYAWDSESLTIYSSFDRKTELLTDFNHDTSNFRLEDKHLGVFPQDNKLYLVTSQGEGYKLQLSNTPKSFYWEENANGEDVLAVSDGNSIYVSKF